MKHCAARMPPSIAPIPSQDVQPDGGLLYKVKSTSVPNVTYSVRLQSEGNAHVPSCECVDFNRHFLPCKHLLAVIRTSEWESLPSYYRNFPQFNLDPQLSTFQSPAPLCSQGTDQQESDIHMGMSAAATTTVSDDVSVSHDLSQTRQTSQPTNHSQSIDNLQSSVRQALSTMINYTYVVSDGEFLRASLRKIEQQLQQFRDHANHQTAKEHFRLGRRTVKGNITARLQRRRLAVIRGTKRSRRLKQRRKTAGNSISQTGAD